MQALSFVKRHGIVLASARGPVPALALEIAGGPIRGSWWSHPKSQEIFHALSALGDSPDVLTCRLVDGKVTFVHRRLWPALVRLAGALDRKRLAWVREEHTSSGAHKVTEVPFPKWVPAQVQAAAARLSEDAARVELGPAIRAV